MKKSFLLMSILGTVFLTGCVSSHYNPNVITPTSEDRILVGKTPVENEAVLEVVRINNFGVSACYLGFLIDDQLAGRIDTNEKATFHLPAGEHKFQVTFDWFGRGLCSVKEEWCRTRGQIRSQVLEPGRKYEFRIGVNTWGGVLRLFMDPKGTPIKKE